MKWLIPLVVALLMGCSPASQEAPRAQPVVNLRDAVINGAPKASLSADAPSVSNISELGSIEGSYFTHSGGALEINPTGAVQVVNLLGHAQAKGSLEVSPQGTSLVLEDGKRISVSRLLLGLRVGSETLLRQDGQLMVDLPKDERLIGRFVSDKGGELVSNDGKVLDYLPSDPLQRVQWRRYMHPGNYASGSNGQFIVALNWVHALENPEDLSVSLMPKDQLRIGDEVFQRTSANSAGPAFAGNFKDARGNQLSIDRIGKVQFDLSFPGKANKIKAQGRARWIGPHLAGVVAEEVGRPFSFTVRQLGMGHVLVYLPAAAGSSPLVLMAPVDQRKETVEVAKQGLYLNPEAYDIAIDPNNKLLLAAKEDVKTPEDMRTPGAVSRTLIGVELYPKGAAKLHYNRGAALMALVDQGADGELDFYFADYQDQPLYQSKEQFSFKVELSEPEDGFRHVPVPTLSYADLRLRHYQTAAQDILAEAFEKKERLKDEETSAVLEADPAIMLSKAESQAERERRMRRREDGRNGGDPTPDVGAFYVSKHQARVMEMNKLGMQLTSLPPARNAFELRANLQKDKDIRARAAQLAIEEEKERQTAP